MRNLDILVSNDLWGNQYRVTVFRRNSYSSKLLWNFKLGTSLFRKNESKESLSGALGGSTKGAWQNSITVRVRAQPSGFVPFFWSGTTQKKEHRKHHRKWSKTVFTFDTGVGKRKRAQFLRFAIDYYLRHWKRTFKILTVHFGRVKIVHKIEMCKLYTEDFRHGSDFRPWRRLYEQFFDLWPLGNEIRRNGPKRYNKLMT